MFSQLPKSSQFEIIEKVNFKEHLKHAKANILFQKQRIDHF
jgi:hypothetical protein